MKQSRYIGYYHSVFWHLVPEGKLIGTTDVSLPPLYEFWISNPPAPDSKNHGLFVSICELAVSQGMLRRIHMYAIV